MAIAVKAFFFRTGVFGFVFLVIGLSARADSPERQFESLISLNRQSLIFPTILNHYFKSLSKRTVVEHEKGSLLWKFLVTNDPGGGQDVVVVIKSNSTESVERGSVVFTTTRGRLGFSFFCEKLQEKLIPFEQTQPLIFAGVLKLDPSSCGVFQINGIWPLAFLIRAENHADRSFGGVRMTIPGGSNLDYKIQSFFDGVNSVRRYAFVYPLHSTVLDTQYSPMNDSISFGMEGVELVYSDFSGPLRGIFDQGVKSSLLRFLVGYGYDFSFPLLSFMSARAQD